MDKETNKNGISLSAIHSFLIIICIVDPILNRYIVSLVQNVLRNMRMKLTELHAKTFPFFAMRKPSKKLGGFTEFYRVLRFETLT